MRMKILFVAMPDSIHAARWMNQLVDEDWDIHLAPCYPAPCHPTLHKKIIYHDIFSTSFISRISWEIFTKIFPQHQKQYNKTMPAQRLAVLIERLRPDVVHSMRMQQSGTLTLKAKKTLTGKKFPRWIMGCWGSDIYLFGRLINYIQDIKTMLGSCDYFIADCKRDIKLARDFGFTGEALPVLPGGGGYDISKVTKSSGESLPSSRKTIAVKGHQFWAGRALIALKAIEMCADILKSYTIVVYSAIPDVEMACELLTESTALSIEIMPNSSHEAMLNLFGRSRISLALSISDGLPQTLLESMLMGAFPIQSNTCCGDEWLKDGESAFFVPPEDPIVVAQTLRRALKEDALVDRAALINYKMIKTNFDQTFIKPQIINLYRKVGSQGYANDHQ